MAIRLWRGDAANIQTRSFIGWGTFVLTVVLATGLGILLADLLLHAAKVRCSLPLFEKPQAFEARRYSSDPDAELFSVAADDGLALAGCLWRSRDVKPPGVVVFCHEMNSDRWSARWYCHGLMQAGYAVVAFDFRNHGESGRQAGYVPTTWATEFEVRDVAAVLRFVQQRPEFQDVPIGVFGVSRGGVAALSAATRLPQIRAAAGDSVFSTEVTVRHFMFRLGRLYFPGWFVRLHPQWHARITSHSMLLLSQWRKRCRFVHLERDLLQLRRRPVLLIAGSRDTYATTAMTCDLHERLGGQPDRLWLVPGARHNEARAIDAAGYDRRIVGFFDAHLAEPRPCVAAPPATREPQPVE